MNPDPNRQTDKASAGRRAAALGALLAAVVCVGAIVTVVAVRERSGAEAAAPAERKQRAAAPETEADDQTVVITWVGDTMLGTTSAVPPDNGKPMFAKVRQWIKPADLALGNLEGVLSERGASKCGGASGGTCFAFRAPTASAKALRWAGFDVMNMANNHAMDYGADARMDTKIALAKSSIASTGGPGEIAFILRNGIRFALIGLAPYPWAQDNRDLAGAAKLVKAARRKADVVIAMVHAGAEGSDKTHTPTGTEYAFGEDRGNTREMAYTLIDAGAALVLGSGPHVIRGVQRYHGRMIAYSLGNFAGWHNFASGSVLDQTGVLRVTINKDGRVLDGRWLSAQLVPPGVPVPQPSNLSANLARSVSIADFGKDAWPMKPDGRLAAWDAK